ncbi:hypothetical protein ACFQ6N_12555 [Kitasatospora sp. NPDC056446]|uniref:hypothetical protein n=1 Tax=Kitasatospora sp. NPDC056446 TaxID=3345819 RepID=UPI0036B3FC4E
MPGTPTLKVVDITPKALSGTASQDSEPFLAVNPEQPAQMVATAFTPDPMNGPLAPVYVSTDGGDTWALRTIVPGAAPQIGTADITVAFAARGGALYAGILNGQAALHRPQPITRMQILRAPGIASTAPMEILVSRDREDQPWVTADTVAAGGADRDRVYIGNNGPGPRSATVDVSGDARTAPAPAGFGPTVIEQRDPAGQDGPPVRLAVHPDGTVYAAFESWRTNDDGRPVTDVTFDVVVTRDDGAGLGANPFRDLKDAADSTPGQRVATDRFIAFNSTMGQERLGGDLTIAVDPTGADRVWIAWCDRVGGPGGVDNTLHVRHSADRGQTWQQVRDDITDAKNPALAVNADGLVGLVYQRFAQNQWTTVLEVTADNWRTAPESDVLHQAPADVPVAHGLPYLGDYIRILAVGTDFYGIFAGNNTPDRANFPVGVTYLRNADFTTHQLLSTDGATRVAPSIDPFFFHRAA